MPRILLVKTSSLGDVVHNLPVASDIARALPGAEVDWVVEESYVSLPALHPNVSRVVPAAVRRWRGRLWQPATWREISHFTERLRAERYDAIVDTQGLLKSAVIARAARGRRHGLGFRASREPLFAFYDRTYDVSRALHAVQRNRALAGLALGYEPPSRVDFGIRAPQESFDWLPAARYAVLVHASSAGDKLWPEAHWTALGIALGQRGIASVLPWGNDAERERSGRLAASIPHAVTPPRLTLAHAAALLGRAEGVVGVDTGLTHLAGALGVATVGVYVATDPAATGLYGCVRAESLGRAGAVPEADAVLATLERLAA